MRKSLKKIVSAITAGVMALALGVTVIPSVAFAEEVTDEAIALGKKDFDPNGEYNAYFMFQADGCWIFRDPFYKKTTGMENENWDKMLTTLDVEDAKPVDGQITDVKIKGNGTYTVGVKGLNGCITNSKEESHVKFVGVSTDIPSNDTVKITNVKTKIDGITKLTQDNAIIDDEAQKAVNTINFNTANTYRNSADLKTDFQLPNDSVEVTFTVSGFAKDDPDAKEATPTPAAKSNDKKDDSKSSVPVIPIVVVVAVVVVAGVVVVVTSKKKKK